MSAGGSATSAAAATATRSARTSATGAGVLGGRLPAKAAPQRLASASCPSAPMLKRPARCATWNAKPVKTSGVALKST
jgi:hypothetical protein